MHPSSHAYLTQRQRSSPSFETAVFVERLPSPFGRSHSTLRVKRYRQRRTKEIRTLSTGRRRDLQANCPKEKLGPVAAGISVEVACEDAKVVRS